MRCLTYQGRSGTKARSQEREAGRKKQEVGSLKQAGKCAGRGAQISREIVYTLLILYFDHGGKKTRKHGVNFKS